MNNLFYDEAGIDTVYYNLKQAYPLLEEMNNLLILNNKTASAGEVVAIVFGTIFGSFILISCIGLMFMHFRPNRFFWVIFPLVIFLFLVLVLILVFCSLKRKKRKETNEIRINEIANEIAPLLNVIPEQYMHFHAVKNFVYLIETGRVESQKEMFDKYEELCFRENLQFTANETLIQARMNFWATLARR